MAWNYDRLWKLLIDRNMNKSTLRQKCHIGTNALAKMGRNEQVSMSVLEKICHELKCDISEIVKYDQIDLHKGVK